MFECCKNTSVIKMFLLFVALLQLCLFKGMAFEVCSNAHELDACKLDVEKKQQELLYARTTTINIGRVDIDMGRSWQYTNSTYHPSVAVVKIENYLGVGCTTCTKKIRELQKVLAFLFEENIEGTVPINECPTTSDVQTCRSELAELTKELVAVRNTSILVQNVTVEMGSTWQYRESTFNQSYTTVKVTNKGNACGKCAEGMNQLQSKLRATIEQLPSSNTTNSCTGNVAFQYQPTSCLDLAKFNPDSPSGYYWLLAKGGSLVQIHCLFGEPTESNPAISCSQIKEKFPTSQSSYYWLRSPDGEAVQAFCDMEH